MPEDRNSDGVRAEAEALEWIVALQESPDDSELRDRFERWLAADPLNAAAWEETAQVYSDIGETRPVHTERWEKLTEQRKPALAFPIRAARRHDHARAVSVARQRETRRPLLKFGLPAAAAAALAVFAMPEVILQMRADEVAGTGELREIELADGSRANLASGSAIAIDYTDSERRVTLLRGQAWFEVQDGDKPFRVVAGLAETTDIGTSFEVGLIEDAVHVAVAEGIVRVDDIGTDRIFAERLTAGQSVIIGAAGETSHGLTSPELVGTWRDGQLAVQDRPMSEVIEALRPWYGGVIMVQSDDLARRRVTGVYDLRDPAGAMTALAKAYGGRVTTITPWLLILSES